MKEDKKKKLIAIGAEIMHLKGYNDTGVQEILDKAGLPKGSFYNFFKSKEEFGLQVIDYFMSVYGNLFKTFLEDAAYPPLERIRRMNRWFIDFFKSKDYTLGCPIGNFAQEMGDTSPVFQEKIKDSLDVMIGQFSAILREAQECGQISKSVDTDKTARFILSSWEGALMHMKAIKSSVPLEIHAEIIFDYLKKA